MNVFLKIFRKILFALRFDKWHAVQSISSRQSWLKFIKIKGATAKHTTHTHACMHCLCKLFSSLCVRTSHPLCVTLFSCIARSQPRHLLALVLLSTRFYSPSSIRVIPAIHFLFACVPSSLIPRPFFLFAHIFTSSNRPTSLTFILSFSHS